MAAIRHTSRRSGGREVRRGFRRPLATWFASLACLSCLTTLAPAAFAQSTPLRVGTDVRSHANSVLAIMSYTTVPDVTTSSLSINNGSTGNPGFWQTQLGGGFTLSRSFPLYLEGTLAYSRYDPTFVASDGSESRALPVRWNTLSTTIGVGWDIRLADELVLRPILNGSLGRVASDLRVGETLLNRATDLDTQFLKNGALNAYGLGGSLMLDFEHYREAYEVDVELRLTNIHLRSFGSSSAGVQGSANAQQLSLWSRWRAPTGLRALDRPVRYVLEAAYSQYFGDSAGVLGFNNLTSLGVGLELDSSKYPVIVTRTRLMARYVFGHNVQGVSFGFAMSF
ncbi:hypothetical protein [Pandoraea sputorum]